MTYVAFIVTETPDHPDLVIFHGLEFVERVTTLIADISPQEADELHSRWIDTLPIPPKRAADDYQKYKQQIVAITRAFIASLGFLGIPAGAILPREYELLARGSFSINVNPEPGPAGERRA
jgi:hypothetical protein